MKRTIILALALALGAALTGCSLVNPCTSTAARSVMLPVADATTVRIIAGAGTVDVVGLTGITRVTATGTACATNDFDLETLQFVTGTNGTEIMVEARTPAGGTSFDITVEVPDTFRVEITDSSGDIVVRHVAGVRLNDGSGDALVEYVTGEVVVESDGTGGLTLLYVDGGVEIASDGSGDIDVRHIGGDVIVGEDGSGDITVSDVEGDFRVRRMGRVSFPPPISTVISSSRPTAAAASGRPASAARCRFRATSLRRHRVTLDAELLNCRRDIIVPFGHAGRLEEPAHAGDGGGGQPAGMVAD